MLKPFMMKKLIYTLCCSCLLLSACFHFQQLETPNITQQNALKELLWFEITDSQSDVKSLLSIQPLGNNQWRWIQVDLLGSPIARQIMGSNWQNEGFLPPNPEAQQLFYYMVAIIADLQNRPISEYYHDIISKASGDVTTFYQKEQPLWQVQRISNHVWEIKTMQQQSWKIRLIKND